MSAAPPLIPCRRYVTSSLIRHPPCHFLCRVRDAEGQWHQAPDSDFRIQYNSAIVTNDRTFWTPVDRRGAIMPARRRGASNKQRRCGFAYNTTGRRRPAIARRDAGGSLLSNVAH